MYVSSNLVNSPAPPAQYVKTIEEILQELSRPEWSDSIAVEALKQFTQIREKDRCLTVLYQIESHLETMSRNSDDQGISNTLIKMMEIYENFLEDESSKEIERAKLETYKIVERFIGEIKNKELLSNTNIRLAELSGKMSLELLDKIARYLHPYLYEG